MDLQKNFGGSEKKPATAVTASQNRKRSGL